MNKAVIALMIWLALLPQAARAQENTGVAGDTIARPAAREQFVTGRIKSVSAPATDQELLRRTGMVTKSQLAEVEITEGRLAGSTVSIPNEITDNPCYNVLVKPGQEVILCVVEGPDGKTEINIADYKRETAIFWLSAVFLAVFAFFGGRQGLKSLAGLVISIASIFFVLLPLSLKGVNPLLTATLVCFVSTAATMCFTAGLSRKAFSAIAGTFGGVLLAGVAAQVVIVCAPLIGLSSEEAQILRSTMLSQPPVFWQGLLAAGMLIGALGVIMDVGISIASSIWEVNCSQPGLSAGQLYRSGMNVGRDIMGTMTTTLVLAYAGGALPLLLLGAQTPSSKILNLDLVATEITAALTGSLGLIATIPLTAYVAANLMSGGGRVKRARELQAEPSRVNERASG